jgi:hypothetical protein
MNKIKWWWLEGAETCSPVIVDIIINCCVWLPNYMSYIVISLPAAFMVRPSMSPWKMNTRRRDGQVWVLQRKQSSCCIWGRPPDPRICPLRPHRNCLLQAQLPGIIRTYYFPVTWHSPHIFFCFVIRIFTICTYFFPALSTHLEAHLV